VQSGYKEVFTSRMSSNGNCCQKKFPLKKSSIELVVVKNWVEFWRWQSKLIERNGKKGIRLCKKDFMCELSYTETVINLLPGHD
jgi:hypothetical protein